MKELINFNKIENNLIYFNTKIVCIIKVEPIDYELKSNLERKSILNNFKNFLILLEDEIQFYIDIKRLNLQKNIKYIKECRQVDENVLDKQILSSYIEHIKSWLMVNELTSSTYYIVLKEELSLENINDFNLKNKYIKEAELNIKRKAYDIINNLTKCQNESRIINTSEIKNIIKDNISNLEIKMEDKNV